jgi:hypothetical protein
MKKLLLVPLALLVLPLFVERVSACSCVHGITVCKEYQEAAVVFVGKVLDGTVISTPYEVFRPGGGKQTFTTNRRVYRFSIEKVFKRFKGTEIEIHTGYGDTDCGYKFKVGERYLIYAHGSPPSNEFTTSICTRTKPYSKASEDLDYLHGLPDSATITRVSGTVSEFIASPFGERLLSGIKVVISGAGRKIEVFTNSEGLFQATGLPAGNYKVWAVFPDKRRSIERKITLPAGGCATLGIEAKGKSN